VSLRIFIHGLDSSNQGTKSVFFREKYPDMVIPHFTGPLAERMKSLRSVLLETTGVILVGSSFGGLMATIFAMENEPRVERMILLAPAINLVEFADYRTESISVPVWVYHGRYDDVIPLNDVEKVARRVFHHLSFHVVEDDHNLHKTFRTLDWDRLLSWEPPKDAHPQIIAAFSNRESPQS
jgi:pimeloyl-ACP methyl ester carboxylesterase